jgi:hypothetical protein
MNSAYNIYESIDYIDLSSTLWHLEKVTLRRYRHNAVFPALNRPRSPPFEYPALSPSSVASSATVSTQNATLEVKRRGVI